jgi:hypothetical protein
MQPQYTSVNTIQNALCFCVVAAADYMLIVVVVKPRLLTGAVHAQFKAHCEHRSATSTQHKGNISSNHEWTRAQRVFESQVVFN